MKTSYSLDDLEQILFTLRTRPSEGMKQRIKAIEETIERMKSEQENEEKPDDRIN